MEEATLRSLLTGAGIMVLKMTARGKVMEKRLRLSNDRIYLTYTPSAKESAALALDVIVAVRRIVAPSRRMPPGYGGVEVQRINGSSWALLVPLTDVRLWVTVLKDITGVQTRKLCNVDPQQQRAIRMWRVADTDEDGCITDADFLRCLEAMNFPDSDLDDRMRIFAKYLDKDAETLDYIGFSAFYSDVTERDDLRPLFEEFAITSKRALTESEFAIFLRCCQAEVPTPAALRAMFSDIGQRTGQISFTQFARYITRPDLNPALAPWTSTPLDDMDQPFSEYFINSWHQASTGDKQMDQGTILEIALERGCRRFELELLDGPGTEPVTFPSPNLELGRLLELVDNRKSASGDSGQDFPVLLLLKDRTASCAARVQAILQEARARQLVVAMDDTTTPDMLRQRIAVRLLTADEAVGRTVEDSKMDKLLKRTLVPNPTALWAQRTSAAPHVFSEWAEPLRLNDAFFAANGSSGYVLMPPAAAAAKQPGNATPPPPPSAEWKVTVTVLFGSQLPKCNDAVTGSNISPYVRLKLFDAKDESNAKQVEGSKTVVVADNGFSPAWNQQPFSFLVANMDLALLSLRVLDARINLPAIAQVVAAVNDLGDKELCEAVLPVRAIRRGYRAVGLKLCSNGEPLPTASLMCHFDIEAV